MLKRVTCMDLWIIGFFVMGFINERTIVNLHVISSRKRTHRHFYVRMKDSWLVVQYINVVVLRAAIRLAVITFFQANLRIADVLS